MKLRSGAPRLPENPYDTLDEFDECELEATNMALTYGLRWTGRVLHEDLIYKGWVGLHAYGPLIRELEKLHRQIHHSTHVAGDDVTVTGPMFDGKFNYGLRDIRGPSAPQMAWLLFSESSQRPPVCSGVAPFLPPQLFTRPER